MNRPSSNPFYEFSSLSSIPGYAWYTQVHGDMLESWATHYTPPKPSPPPPKPSEEEKEDEEKANDELPDMNENNEN